MSPPELSLRLLGAREKWRRYLLSQVTEAGHWEGELASSALSTAVAVTALKAMDEHAHADAVTEGVAWLVAHANRDGGFGDTVRSNSNLSTTALCYAALRYAGGPQAEPACRNALTWLEGHVGEVRPETLAKAILDRYAEDRTFSVPILMMLAVCGCLGPRESAWRHVMRLPFELAALPRQFYSAVRLPVVSYALPALIAIGQVIHHYRGGGNPLSALLRKLTKPRTLRLLQAIQPSNGGFLEAVPLTGFVTISLAQMGQKAHAVAEKGSAFLRRSQRDDGSWPIDTHLATWVSTLATNALLHCGQADDWASARQAKMRRWLLDQQYRVRHPYTGAAPGGWAWTPLPGGVPDADDTAGAVMALARLDDGSEDVRNAAANGLDWLAGLQNRDGGIPTFCKGWGTLPFDQSCADISAHAIQAVATWAGKGMTKPRWQTMVARAWSYLRKTQSEKGFWQPLWFGNQHHAAQKNPTYGTARVLLALSEAETILAGAKDYSASLERGTAWLISIQKEDGSWGGDSGLPATLEETAVAISALANLGTHFEAVRRGLAWLLDQPLDQPASPIGFYFANLWYFEKLYPVVWTVQALEIAETNGIGLNSDK